MRNNTFNDDSSDFEMIEVSTGKQSTPIELPTTSQQLPLTEQPPAPVTADQAQPDPDQPLPRINSDLKPPIRRAWPTRRSNRTGRAGSQSGQSMETESPTSKTNPLKRMVTGLCCFSWLCRSRSPSPHDYHTLSGEASLRREQ